MNRTGLISAVALMLAGGPCASGQTPPVVAAPGPSPTVAPPAPPSPPAAIECDAKILTYLIGRPRTEIPVPLEPSRRRVYCSSCFVTEDYRPERTNIIYDPQTGLVTAVKCG